MSEIFEAIGGFWRAIPTPLSAILTLIGGWLAAIALRFLVSSFLALVRFDKLSEKTGIAEFLRKGKVSYSPSRLAGVLAYWIVLTLTLIWMSRALDPGIARSLSDRIDEFVPSVFAALFIVIVGAILISFLANFAMTIARNAAVPNARSISRGIKYIGNAIVLTMALEQLGLTSTILGSVFLILFAAVSFGLALSFGLGCKDMAKGAMERFIRNMREREREGRETDLEG
jgi:hypothetical protein